MTTSRIEAPTLHSNALNFQSFVQSGVDSRTGLYTVSMAFPDVKTCDLSGPVLPLRLAFSPINPINSGYGTGWRLGLTQYSPHSRMIALHSGESLKVTGNYSDEGDASRLKMKEQKIQSFKLYQLTGDSRGQYKVVHTSGLVEILKLTGSEPQVAMPVKLYSPQGHDVSLYYGGVDGGRMLTAVRDSQGLLLEVLRNPAKSTVEIYVKPVDGLPPTVFTLHLEGDRLARLSLPTANKAGWRFLYGLERDQLCIKEVWTPVGGHEQIQYNDQGHGFPGKPEYPNLPRVTEHITDPGAGQPPIKVKYTYSSNNFLGYNSTVEWESDGEDKLYLVTGRYEYQSTESLMVENVAVRTVTRTFNRFHLMTTEVSTQGNARKTLTHTYYANDTDSFEKQDRRCQLPRQVTELWHLTDDPRSWRQDKKITEYDIHGNLTLTVQPNGIKETIAYYPAEGVPGQCPADPHGFVRNIREKTVTPTTDSTRVPDLQSGAPTLISRYRYELMPPVSGGTTPWIALIENQLLAVEELTENLLQHVVYAYYDTPTNLITHGRRHRQALTMMGHTTATDFIYSKPSATYATFAGETVLRTEETLSTDLDSAIKSVTTEHSLLTGEPVLITDKDEQVRYTYDALGRVVTEMEAPNTPYPASRSFSYTLIRPAGAGEDPVTGYAGQEMEDVKKVKIRSWVDGLGRVIKEERQDLDNAGELPPVFRTTYEASYDAFSEVVSETEIDWLEKSDLRLTKTYTYDRWGQRDSVTGPDGITSHTQVNPITFTAEQWTEGVGKSVTLSNRFEKPVSTEQFDLNGRRISLHRYKYDGLSHCTEEIDAVGRVTRFSYDAHGRLVSNTLPDRTVIGRTYAPHTATPLVTALTVQPGNVLLPSITLGTQSFDGLCRLKKTAVGGRVQQLEYEAGQLQPSLLITAAGKHIKYEYKPGLTTQPTAIKAEEGDATFEHDLLNGNLETSSNARGSYSFSYSHAGHLSVESWKEPASPQPWVTRYTSSLKGRQLSRTDVGNQVTNAEYDLVTGRLIGVHQCQLQARFEYDACGRLYRTTSTDLGTGNTLTTTLTFDDLGREKIRTLTLAKPDGQRLQPERSIELTYLADGNLSARHLRVGDKTALLETFSYDLRGRLELQQNSGDDLPRDRFGNSIVRQYFEFDALDNVVYSRIDFKDGSHDIARFGFSAEDPCQLVHVTHSHADYQGLATDFTYDADGNLTHDELNQQLHYDSFGRLLSVNTADGQPITTYAYDAHDHLVAVKPQAEPELLRFYEGLRLSDTMQDGEHTQLLNYAGHPLGQQAPGDSSKTLLLLTDAKHSVIAESQADELRTAAYTAYGERSNDAQLKSLVAFNGEVCDPASGWYLLGRGYRAYNPCLMRFQSPDSMSPFGAGGINCYKYCSGNPIAFSDPTGHALRPMGGKSNKFHHKPEFAYGVTGAAGFLGIVLSIVLLNPAPIALAFTVIAAAANVSTAVIVTVTDAFLAFTVASTVVAKAATVPSTVASLGVGGAGFAVKGQKTQEGLYVAGIVLDSIMLPQFEVAKPGLPTLIKSTNSLRKASSASNDVRDFLDNPPTGDNWVLQRKKMGKETGRHFPPQSMQNRILNTMDDFYPDTVSPSGPHTAATNSNSGFGSPTGHAPSQPTTNSAVRTPESIESFQIDSLPAPRVQEWLGSGIRQAVHKPILSLSHTNELK